MLYKEKFICTSSQGDWKSLFSGYRTFCLKFRITLRIILLCQRNLDSIYLLLDLKFQTTFLAIQKSSRLVQLTISGIYLSIEYKSPGKDISTKRRRKLFL
jgi:hypothetical protein